jgi:RAQPRD family integrative conjugative element protein
LTSAQYQIIDRQTEIHPLGTTSTSNSVSGLFNSAIIRPQVTRDALRYHVTRKLFGNYQKKHPPIPLNRTIQHHFIAFKVSNISLQWQPYLQQELAMTPSIYSLTLCCVIAVPVGAQDIQERSNLGLMQQQIQVFEQLADHARRSSINSVGARYRFDYLGFVGDLKRIQRGIHNYLTPSRAQPADPTELTGDYRAETPYPGSSQ